MIKLEKGKLEVQVKQSVIADGERYETALIVAYRTDITNDELNSIKISKEDYIKAQVTSMVAKLGGDIINYSNAFQEGNVDISLLKIVHDEEKEDVSKKGE